MKAKQRFGGALVLGAAVALCTTGTADAQCDSVLVYDNGFPFICGLIPAQVNSPASAAPEGADDFTLPNGAIVNDIHWYTLDASNGIDWSGGVRVKIYRDGGCDVGPDKNASLVFDADLQSPIDADIVRTIIDPAVATVGGESRDLVRYDLRKIDVSLPAGTYWLSVAPISNGPAAPGGSSWISSRCVTNDDTIVGCPAYVNLDDGGGWFSSADSNIDSVDLNFQLTSCPLSAPDCPADIADFQGPNPDGQVNIFDLTTLLGNWNTNGPGANIADPPNNIVDVFDLTALLSAFGHPCPLVGSNDDCEFATLIAGTGLFQADLTGATPDGPADGCGTHGQNDVWFCWKAECSGPTTIVHEMLGGLRVYEMGDDCSGDLGDQLLCLDTTVDSGVFFANAGEHFKIRVDDAIDTLWFFQISDCVPDNDECENAIQLFSGDAYSGDLLGFTADSGVPSCDVQAGQPGGPQDGENLGSTPGVWFVTVGDGATLTASTCPDFGLGAQGQADVIAIYCGSACDGLLPACIQFSSEESCSVAPNTQNTARWCGVDGVIYFIYYAMQNFSTPGPYTLVLTGSPGTCTPTGPELGCPGLPGDVCNVDDDTERGIGSGANCNLSDLGGHGADGIIGATSDRNPGAGFTVAENFVLDAAGMINEICWWGIYVDFGAGSADCAPGDSAGDDFRLRILADDSGIPNDDIVLWETTAPYNAALNVEKQFTGDGIGGAAREMWEFTYAGGSVSENGSRTLAADTCYWLEISAESDFNCFWLWVTAPPGDGRSFQDTSGDGYNVGEDNDFDHAFCLDLDLGDLVNCPASPERPLTEECNNNGNSNIQQGPSLGGAVVSDEAQGANPTRVADNFEVTTAGTVNAVCWWGKYEEWPGFTTCQAADHPPADNFTLTMFAQTPALLPDVNNALILALSNFSRTATGFLLLGSDPDLDAEFVYYADITNGPTLQVGDVRWLGVYNNTATLCDWLYENGNDGDGSAAISTDQGATYASIGLDNAFRLYGVEGGPPVPPPAPANDLCADAIVITDGTTGYSTLGAGTDGPANPIDTCDDFGSNNTHHDIWYTYTATCTGTLRVTTCDDLHGEGDATYDTDLVAYSPGWDCTDLAASFLTCNDDDQGNACGTNPPWASTMFVPVTAGQTYLIRVGGWGDGDAGLGVVQLTCTP